MTRNSDNQDTSGGVIPDGEQVTFASDRGPVNPTTATITDGTATSTLTAQNPGTGSATATVDNETASVAITVSELPTISIDNVKKEECDNGTTPFKFTVTLDKPSDEEITVDFATENGTAKNNDYEDANGTITFAPGDTSERTTVQVNGDERRERNETFFVNLSNASGNATIADDRGKGTIDNDDQR